MGQKDCSAFRVFGSRLRLGLIGLVSGLGLLLVGACNGCTPEKGPEPGAYPYSARETRGFIAGPSGLAPFDAPRTDESGRLVLSAREGEPGAILVAMGGYGVALIEPDRRGEAYRIRTFPSPSFDSLDPGGAWPYGGGFLVQLFRNPLAASAEGVPARERLFRLDENGLRSLSLKAPAETAASGEILFSLFPDPRSSQKAWLAQFRSEGEGTDEPVQSSYASFGGLEEPGRPLERWTFEDVLRPRSLEGGGRELREAVDFCGADAVLARLRDVGGGEGYWYAGDEAVAHSLEMWKDGDLVLALGPDGRGAFSGSFGSIRLSFEVPLPGAFFDSAVFLRTETGILVVASWERIAEQKRVSGLLVHTFEHLR